MAIKLGEIFVSLGLSTASFTKNLNDAKKLAFGTSKEWERSFKIMGQAVVSAGAAIGTALFAMTRAGINTAAQFHDLSQSTGVTVETLSNLAVAAKTAGLDTQSLALNLARLAKNMAQAAAGGREQLRAFQALGISVRDSSGGLRSIEDVLGDVAAAFAGMEDGTAKTAVAMQLFGRAGMAMVPLLNEGKTGLAAMTEQAKRLGLVISSETARAADKFSDDLDILKKQLEAVGIGIASEILPNLNKMSGGLLSASGNAQEFGRTLGGTFSHVSIELGEMGLEFEIALAKMARGMVLLAATSPVLEIFAGGTLRKRAQELQDFIGGLQIQLDLIHQETQGVALPSHGRTPKLGGLEIVDEQAAAASKKHAEAIQGIIGKLREQIATFGMSDVAVNVYKAALEGASPAQQQLIHDLGITVQQLEFMRKKLLDVAVVPTFQLPAGAEELDTQIEQAALQMAEFAKNTERALEAMRGLGIEAPKMQTPLSDLAISMREFAVVSADALGDWLIRGGSFKQLLQSLVEQFARMIFNLLVIRPLMAALGFLVPTGGFFGIPRQHGGPVWPGQSFIVGEAGPERFLPAEPGLILPHGMTPVAGHGLGMGGLVIHNHIDNRGADVGTTIKTAALLDRWALRQFAGMMQDRQLRTA